MVFGGLLPKLNPDEMQELAKRLEEGATFNPDFWMAMVLSTALASLGLLQNSTPVIIGAMLVAPLVWPLLAAGLGLVQANAHLFNKGMVVAAIGVCMGFGVSLFFGLINPGFEPTMEVEARGTPDLFDLLIAFISGLIAAYAMSRVNVWNIIAGVAIAAALVPPLSVVGIALGSGRLVIAANACILLLTNLVAIIFGAAIIFRLMGVYPEVRGIGTPAWKRTAVMSLLLLSVLLIAPLLLHMVEKRRAGQNRPLLHPVSPRVRQVVNEYLDDWPGVELIMMGRQSVEPETGIAILLSTQEKMPLRFEKELKNLVREARGDNSPVRVFPLRSSLGNGD
jgi:uncharacterized hydrophobic protein (TIGR00271 family)